jgi:flagellar biosynthetic protein FlhB
MADKPASERTEKPTPERLRKAREEGQVPQSQEVPTALTLSMLLLLLGLVGAGLFDWFKAQARQGLMLQGAADPGAAALTHVLAAKCSAAVVALLPFILAGAAVSIFASLISSGWAVSPKAAGLKFGRINPVKGMKNLFSMGNIFRLLMSLAKTALIVVIVYQYMHDKLGACLSLRWVEPGGMGGAVSRLVLGVAGRIALGLVAIAGLDLLFQRWRYKRDLRMTRQELKEERKQHEVSPEVRGRIRAVQIEMVRRRMLQEVPKADVVLTNPTHVAVALKYESETMAAPQVVAKGGDLLAEKIKDIARAHAVPVVQRPQLARSLYAAVDVGETIPQTLFVAVAEVLAMIYRLRRNRLGPLPAGNNT